MTKIFEDMEFHGFSDRNSRKTFYDLEFRRCHFWSSAVSITRDPHKRSIVRNVKLIKCEETGCALDSAVVEDVIIDGLKTHTLLQTWGAVFKHVILKGRIGRIMFSPLIHTGMGKPKEQEAFDEANREYYSHVDWALDLREAIFEECDIRYIPAHLVLRDPITQVVVKLEKAIDRKWMNLDLSGTPWGFALEFFVEAAYPEVILVAPKGRRQFGAWLDGLKKLRDAGIAEPN
jgi:hypothetical protein